MVKFMEEVSFDPSHMGLSLIDMEILSALSGADSQGEGEIEVQAVDVRATEPNQRRMSKEPGMSSHKS